MHEAHLGSISTQASPSLGIASRKPKRLTITVSWSVYQSLVETSDLEGRSLSNTAAYWLERQAELQKHKKERAKCCVSPGSSAEQLNEPLLR